MKDWILYVVVTISGAAILAIEILGTRILGPFYGVSLYLWSALISVTLLSLSLGYLWGGSIADRYGDFAHLGRMLSLAGIWLLLIPWLRQPLLNWLDPLWLRAAVLLAALVLFAPSLILLGMISPMAVKLKTKDMNELGRSAGKLYAVSTIASVIAAIVTGFFLIPNFGLRSLTWSIGLLLLISGLIISICCRRNSRTFFVSGVLLFFGLCFGGAAFLRHGTIAPGLLFKTSSPYGEIPLWEDQGLRYLLLDGAIQTCMIAETGQPYLEYVPAADLATFMFARDGRALVIGLGGGSLPRNLSDSGYQVDCVEIDPMIIKAARDYFALEPHHAHILQMDGRRYLMETQKTYDLIVLDAYGSSMIPFHLITQEVFQLASARLSPEGILLINLQVHGWHDPLVSDVAATMAVVFRHILALPIHEPPNVIGNLVLFASQRMMTIAEERIVHPAVVEHDDYQHWLWLQRNHAWDNRFVPDVRSGRVITDDHNPVDIRSEAINFTSRMAMRKERGVFQKSRW